MSGIRTHAPETHALANVGFQFHLWQNRVMPHRGGWTCAAGRTRELRKYRLRRELLPFFDARAQGND